MQGNDKEVSEQVNDIKNLFAFELFCRGRFDESLKVFSSLGTGKTNSFSLAWRVFTYCVPVFRSSSGYWTFPQSTSSRLQKTTCISFKTTCFIRSSAGKSTSSSDRIYHGSNDENNFFSNLQCLIFMIRKLFRNGIKL